MKELRNNYTTEELAEDWYCEECGNLIPSNAYEADKILCAGCFVNYVKKNFLIRRIKNEIAG